MLREEAHSRCRSRLVFFCFCWAACAHLLVADPAAAVLNVSVEARPDPVAPGETVNVVAHLANDGALNVLSTSLVVTLPSFIEPFSENALTGSSNCNAGASAALCEPGEGILFVFGTLEPGEGVSVSFPAVVSSGGGAPPNGTVLSFDASGAGSGQGPVVASGAVVVTSAPLLDLALEEDRDPAVPGEQLSYHLTYGNKAASGSLANALLSVPLPAGTTFLEASDGGVLNGGNVEWVLGTLAAGESGARTFVVELNVGLGLGTRIDADATLTAGAPVETARAVARTRVHLAPELQVTIVPTLDPVASGERQSTSLLVSNRSGAAALSVGVVLRLPDWLESFSEAQLVGLANCDRGANAVLCEPGEYILWALGTVPAGAGRWLSLPPLIRSDGRTPVPGEVVSLQVIVADSANRYTTVQRSFAIAPPAPLGLALEVDREPAAPGSDLVWHVRYANRDETDSSPATLLEVVLPPGAGFVSATGGGILVGDRVEWALGSLAAGESGDVTFTLGIDPGAGDGDHLELRARIQNGASPADETRLATVVRVRNVAELQTTLELNPDPLASGERFTLSATISNPSSTASLSAAITLRLPDGIEPFAESVLTGLSNCDRGASAALCEPGESILWALGTLAPGVSRVGELSAIVSQGPSAPAAGNLLRFEAVATDSANRTASMFSSVPIDVASDLTLSLAEDPDPVLPSSFVSYRLDFGNRADAGTAPAPVLEMPLPKGTSFVSATDGGVLVGDIVRWEPGDLGAGRSRSVRLTLQIDSGVVSGTLIVAHARFVDASSPAQRTAADAVTRVRDIEEMHLTLELNPDPVRPGERFNLTVTMSNPSTVTSLSSAITLRLPEGIEPFSEGLLTGLSNCDRGSNAALCEPGEQIFWAFGTIPAGGSRAGDLSAIVSEGAQAPASGELLRFDAIATDSLNRTSLTRRSLPVDAAGRLSLGIDDDLDPVLPGSILNYRITTAFTEEPGSSPANVLTMPIPRGTSFVSATGGGSLLGDDVVWNIGELDLLPAEVGLTVSVDPLLPSGRLIRATAQIADASLPIDRARAEASTRVNATPELELTIDAQPTFVAPGQPINLTLTVTNASATNSLSVGMTLRLPDYIMAFPESTLVVANCDRGLSGALCEPGENIVFGLGTVTPGQVVVRNVPVTITDLPDLLPAGEVIRFYGIVTDGANRTSLASRSVPEPGIGLALSCGAAALGVLGRRDRPGRRCGQAARRSAEGENKT